MAFAKDFSRLTKQPHSFDGFGAIQDLSWEVDPVGPGLWRITSPSLGVLEIGAPGATGYYSDPREGGAFASIEYENAPRGGKVYADQFVVTGDIKTLYYASMTTGKLKMTHGDPSNPKFLYVYDLNFDQKKTLIGTVYDPNSDTRLPFTAYYVGPPGTQLPMVLTYVTTEPRVLPYARTAPLLPVAQTVPPETPVAPPSIVTEQIIATGQQTTTLLPTVSSVAAARILGTTMAPVFSLQPVSAKQSVVELRPTNVINPPLTEAAGAPRLQAGLLGGLSPTLMLLLAGGAALFLFTGKKEEGTKRKRKK